jgi:LacI family transcriptional regulator
MAEGTAARPTIRDIASGAGVSVATVSRVLNGHPDVAPSTREKVLDYVRLNGYTANRTARKLAGGQTGLIGLTIPFVHPEYFAQIVEGAAEALYDRDARFVVCPTMHEHDREVSVLERVMHGTTDGAMLVLPSETHEELRHLLNEGFPFVVVDPALPMTPDVPTVSAANWAGGRSAVEYLASLGHRRIAAITGPNGWLATVDRLAGYRSALLAAGIGENPELVRTGDFTIESGYAVAVELFSLPEPPTAIFAFNDNMAVGVLRAAQERGVRIPDELSLVGFDDIELASFVTPRLTTVHQSLHEMGRLAAGLLSRFIDRQPIDTPHLELATRLIVRESTGPAPR